MPGAPLGYSMDMAGTREKLTAAVESYLADLRRIRASGGATGERSYYPPLTNLLNAVGATLKPKVYCVSELAEQGAGHPDLGLYAARQTQRGRLREGQTPERGVVEVKPVEPMPSSLSRIRSVRRPHLEFGHRPHAGPVRCGPRRPG